LRARSASRFGIAGPWAMAQLPAGRGFPRYHQGTSTPDSVSKRPAGWMSSGSTTSAATYALLRHAGRASRTTPIGAASSARTRNNGRASGMTSLSSQPASLSRTDRKPKTANCRSAVVNRGSRAPSRARKKARRKASSKAHFKAPFKAR